MIHFNTQPLNFTLPQMVANPCGARVGALNLGPNPNPLPKEKNMYYQNSVVMEINQHMNI